MFHVKDDFRAGAPVSQVGAGWFNKVGSFLNNLVGGNGVRIVKNESGPSYIELKDEGDVPSSETGEPDVRTDANEDDYEDGETWTWERGGDNGLKMDVYCEVSEENGWHYLQRCRLTFSKDGLLVSAEKLAGSREIEG